MVLFSLICSTFAALTGIIAIGSGRHWQFSNMDYLRGKRNAILYLWVISSTIFSIVHSGVLVDYGLDNQWALRTPDSAKWFVLHAAMGILLVAAHIYVKVTLAKEVGPVDKFLWRSPGRVQLD
jgi:hypothetical protein